MFGQDHIDSQKNLEHVPTDQLRFYQCKNYDDYRFSVQGHPNNRNGGSIIAKKSFEQLWSKNTGNPNLCDTEPH